MDLLTFDKNWKFCDGDWFFANQFNDPVLEANK